MSVSHKLALVTPCPALLLALLPSALASAQGYETWRKEGRLRSLGDLIDMTVESATLRVRPLVMTVGMNIVGLIPVMIDTGVGSDVAKRVVFYVIWRGWELRRAPADNQPPDPPLDEGPIPAGAR